MHRIMVAGIGTGVGKTIVSAILTIALKGDYWKPIQCGDEALSDSEQVKTWLGTSYHSTHLAAYSFQAPFSPHYAAHLENVFINLDKVMPPRTARPLIIEGVGGILVPLTNNCLTIDLFKRWNCQWVIVSKHYLGSINHTLLTIEVLKQHQISLMGIIFNGFPHDSSETAIMQISQLPFLGRLLPESQINKNILKRYATEWKTQIYSQLQ